MAISAWPKATSSPPWIFAVRASRSSPITFLPVSSSMPMPAATQIGASVHQALNLAASLGYGHELVPSLVKAQAQLNGVRIGQG